MQNFIVLEFTRNAQGNFAVYPFAKETRNAADKKYYDILSNAADSNSPLHGAVLLNWDGSELEHKCYEHTPAPEPEPEPEPNAE